MKEKQNGKQVNVASAMDAGTDQDKPVENKQQEWMAEMIKQEVTKLLKSTQMGKEGSVNFLTADFAGMAKICHSSYAKSFKRSWIVDT